MQLGPSALALRFPTSALRSPRSFVNAIMLGRAVRREASTASDGRKQSPLQLNHSAVNVVPSNNNNNLKRKFDRSMSSTSNLGSLHQPSFDENVRPYVDLTSPEAKYPIIGPVDPVDYPTLPPPPAGSPIAPASSAPVPWSSSPAHHYEQPTTMQRLRDARSPEPVGPAKKKRTLPSSFTKVPDKREGEKSVKPEGMDPWRLKKNNTATTGVRQLQNGGLKQPARSMIDMLEHSSFARQKLTGSLSRDTSAQSSETAGSAIEKDPTAAERVPEVFLSEEQKGVMKAVVEEGKSVFFTGSAGTGKSVLMRSIISQLKHKYRKEPERFAVTASTGLASCILEGQTLHSWSGIGLGKEPAPELIKRIKKNQKSRQKWLRTKVLIIDEVSMVDGALFDKLEQIARTLRNNGRPFGGIQLVVTGDFFQLPPVPEKNTIAKFVFEAVTWATCIQHTILLTHVFRQKDESFARMLNEMRLGKMSPDTVREFKKLSRPLNFHDDLEATELYPRREQVEYANQNRMKKLSGQVMTFDAVDSGNAEPNTRKGLLANYMAPESLDLKKGAQVMLIKNIDQQLVNGSLGIVQSFMDEGTFFTYKDDEPTFLLAQDADAEDDERKAARAKIQEAKFKNSTNGESRRLWPMVRFNLPDGTSRSMLCSPDEWKSESQNGEVLAKRVQVPLILAWALSIHKAQGQTLNRVKVDLFKVFEKGQAYVALSRARSKEGLQVLGFNESKVMVHQKVLDFYSKLSGFDSLDKKPLVKKELKKSAFPDDEFDEDFSIEEALEAEKQMMKAGMY